MRNGGQIHEQEGRIYEEGGQIYENGLIYDWQMELWEKAQFQEKERADLGGRNSGFMAKNGRFMGGERTDY